MMSNQYLSMLQSLLPPGAAFSRDPNSIQAALLQAWSDEFARFDVRIEDLLKEFIPVDVRELLTEWEGILATQDDSTANINLNIDQRLAAVRSKFLADNGQSRQSYINLAASFGFSGATIDEFRPMTCGDNCNNALYSQDDRFVFRVNMPAPNGGFIATCNSDCNCSLGSWSLSKPLVESAISKHRSADTDVIFNYV
jgi:uncharacterized protein YmfQ (DUF2313 family)